MYENCLCDVVDCFVYKLLRVKVCSWYKFSLFLIIVILGMLLLVFWVVSVEDICC